MTLATPRNKPGEAFDPEAHIYRAGLTRLPGATDVIKAEGMVASEWMTDEARWRGKCVHRGIQLLNEGQLDWDTVDETVAGYLKSYQQFLTVSRFEIWGSEVPLFSVAFGCIPDLWGVLNGQITVVELKTGPVPKWAAIQTALQVKAIRDQLGVRVQKRFGLRLMTTGALAKLDPFDDRTDERVAMSMVDSFWWKASHGYIRDWK